MPIKFTLNGKDASYDGDPDTPLLWVLRDDLGLTGTKYGCGVAQCGACTVHLDGMARRACVTPVSTVVGAAVTTIEVWKARSPRRCKMPGSRSTCRNAAIANRVR